MARYANVPQTNAKVKKPKIFVLDTNIILHDYRAIRKFQDNDVFIPVAVIEELDKFKKGNDALSFNARGFMRDLDKLTEGKLFGKYGIPIGKNCGCIKIEPNHPFPPELADLFRDDTQDHRILATAIWVRDNYPDRFVALVTKDINLRIKAKASGMEAQDYLTDRVDENRVENTRKEVQYLDKVPDEVIQTLNYGQDNSIGWESVTGREPAANALFVLNGELAARYDADRKVISLVRSRQAYGIRPRNL